MRIAFVIPWYGKDISGGAEAACRGLAHGIQKLKPEVEVEVITTALKEFATDWNSNLYAEGTYDDEGIPVHRFKAEPVRRNLFHRMNAGKLMPQTVSDLWRDGKPFSPLSRLGERFYIHHMVHSKTLYRYLVRAQDSYDFFIFIPYMFGTTYRGSLLVKDKAIVIPCLHNERYAYMRLYRKMMSSARGVLFHVAAEQRLANRLYDIPGDKQLLLGAMVDVNPPNGDEHRFRKKYGIDSEFILYAGRKVVGKGLPTLVDCFKKCKASSHQGRDVKLVIIGKGDLHYPPDENPDVIDLGFVSLQDKYDAYRAATALCQPSLMESFSIVLMEAWLQETPVLVPDMCEATRDHCQASGGGLVYSDDATFQECLESILKNSEKRKTMGQKGRRYVLENYSPEIIVNKLIDFLDSLR